MDIQAMAGLLVETLKRLFEDVVARLLILADSNTYVSYLNHKGTYHCALHS
jgi:hypothetical protein